jgi:hypothetical protein
MMVPLRVRVPAEDHELGLRLTLPEALATGTAFGPPGTKENA